MTPNSSPTEWITTAEAAGAYHVWDNLLERRLTQMGADFLLFGKAGDYIPVLATFWP